MGTRSHKAGWEKSCFQKKRRKPKRWLNWRYTGISCQKRYCWQFLGSTWIKNWQKDKNKDPNYWRDRKYSCSNSMTNEGIDVPQWLEQGKRRVKRLPGQGARTNFIGNDLCSHKGPSLGLMLCCHHLEILNNLWTWNSAFSFCKGPTNYAADLSRSL